MSRIVYKGEGAGLGQDKGQAGNVNSEYNWELYCSCGELLGVLGAFRQNPEGYRSAYCPKSRHLTIVDKDGQIAKVRELSDAELGALIQASKKSEGRPAWMGAVPQPIKKDK